MIEDKFSIIKKLRNSNRTKNSILYDDIYLYTNAVLSSNNVTIIISSKEINCANTNKVLEEHYKDIYINDSKLVNDINYIFSECYARNLRIKVVFNEIN